ncbi:hypothetical protein [Sphingomicrobium flavum]|uniref:hypothetical protein n=1 Tax=Sphingomicrobium flavum TaxID=1229164 RepID=UPI0035E3EEDD
MPGREAEECFPPALRFKIDDDGNITDIPAEPIAADFRPQGDGRKLAKLKLIAGMLGVPLDGLVQRDQQRRNKRLVWLSAASILGMAITTFLAIAAIQARDEARFQREEANGLVQFMLTDLRDKLEPVGRLDTLDVVGERALAYYEKQDLKDLSPDELGQRAAALNLVGEMANLQGDLDGALVAFREAARTTAEQLERFPDDPQRYFDHSQSSFWVGYTAWQRGDNETARRHFNDYLAAAERMVEFDPDNDSWALELASAHVNLGVLDQEEEKHGEATKSFAASENILLRLGANEAKDRDLGFTLAQTYAWAASSLLTSGDVAGALEKRRAEFALYEALYDADQKDFQPLGSRLFAGTEIAALLLMSGKLAESDQQLRTMQPVASQLLAHDPTNTLWQEFAASFYNQQAETALAMGRLPQARAANGRAIALCRSLRETDSSVENWHTTCLAQALSHAALIARRSGNQDQFTQAAERFRREFASAGIRDKFWVIKGSVMIDLAASDPPDRASLLSRIATHDKQSDPRLAALRTFVEEGRDDADGYPVGRMIGR